MTDAQALCSEASGNSSQPAAEIWRKEIHARVNGYRTRRGRRIEGAYTMRFPFPPPESTTSASATLPSQELEQQRKVPESAIAEASSADGAQIPESLAAKPEVCEVAAEAAAPAEAWSVGPAELPGIVTDPEPTRTAVPRPRPQRKVIAFPRQVTSTPEIIHRLADPVLPEQPRILDVPEELEAFPTTPFLDGLQFGPSTQAVAVQVDNVDLPFRAAGVARRLYAGVLDSLLVAAGATIFAVVGGRMLPGLALSKPVALTAAGMAVLLWAAYQYLLLVYGGATAGMRIARVRLSTFKGNAPRLGERRNRVIALYFSAASVMMGLLWAFVDVDMLCWHDRISRTYLIACD
jgi:uncharacterized RDD family membrane protein YckC